MSNTKEISRLDSTKQTLMKMEGQFASALPKQIPSKKFVRTVMTAISDPSISEKINKGSLDMTSLYASCTKAAADGLLLDGREAALLTFFSNKEKINKAQYIPMVGGLMKKARNSGEISSIISKVVYEGDHFSQWVDETGEHFKHVPCEDSTKRGNPIKVYALGITKDGGTQLEVLERADINAIAKHSKNSDQYDPSKGLWFAEWWRKSAIRKVCKYLPSSSDLDRLFEHDNENYDLDDMEDPREINPAQEPKAKNPRKETAASQAIKSQAAKKKPAPEPGDSEIIDAEFTEMPDLPPNTEAGDPGPGSDMEIPI